MVLMLVIPVGVLAAVCFTIKLNKTLNLQKRGVKEAIPDPHCAGAATPAL
jgi:hypothetical protein